jgi:nucleotide-binding universal stress UspA family protein
MGIRHENQGLVVMYEKKIVVGFDASPMSAAALRWATDYSRASGEPVLAVHTWERPPAEAYGGGWELPDLTGRDVRKNAESWVAAAVGTRPEGVSIELEIVEGPAGPVLVGLASEAALLVVGTREHTGLRRLVNGSVSHYCLSHASCPVVAVPGPMAEKVRLPVRHEAVVSVGPLF